MRIIEEFYCSSCRKYFDVKLNMALNGNHRVHCPNCGHIHYRVIQDGKITNTRFTDNTESIFVDDLYPMKAACRDYQKETYDDCAETDSGFMKRLWKEHFSHVM